MKIQEEKLEREFLQVALKRSEFLGRNEPKLANKEYNKLHRLKGSMRQLPDRGEAALKRIATKADDPDVKILAAAALLAIDEVFATSLLEQVQAASEGFQSLTAEMTIKEWRSGSIREYWS